MPSLLLKVKKNMSIHAHQRVQGLLEGQYGSIFKGRSMDFDDLREYTPGDDIKDIDWKATARSGSTLIKRYIAIRKHNILIVADTGREMSAVSQSGDVKRDIAVMAAGVLGSIAQKHGDLVALVSGDDGSTSYIPLKASNAHLERILQKIQGSTALDSSKSNIYKQLEFVARTIRRRMFLIVITDDGALDANVERMLRRLSAQHELLWVTIGDADTVDSKWQDDELVDVSSGSYVPAFIRSDIAFRESVETLVAAQQDEHKTMLMRIGINSERCTSEQDVVRTLLRLLERQRRSGRR